MLSYWKNIYDAQTMQIESNDTPSLYAETLAKSQDQLDEQGNIIEKATWKEITEEEYLSLQPKEQKIDEKQLKIDALKANLAATDYQAIKYAEGRMTGEEYAPIGEQRQVWRDEINELENA